MNLRTLSPGVLIVVVLIASTSLMYSQTSFWQPINLTTSDGVNALAVSSNGYLYAGAYGVGIYRSTDDGSSWVKPALSPLMGVKCISIASNGYVLAGGEGVGIYRSTDSGNSWNQSNSGLSNLSVYCLCTKANGDLFAGTGDGIFRSTDHGTTWTKINTTTSIKYIISLAISPSGHVFAGTSPGGIYRSTDDGSTWTVLKPNLYILNYSMVCCNSSAYLFAGTTTGGVFRSTDNGDTWTQINNGITSAYIINGLAVNKSGHLFAATQGGGAYRSTDNGTTWTQINSGLKDLIVYCFALHPNGNIYTGTSKGGVAKSGSATEVTLTRSDIPVSFALSQNYPNPFNPSTTIQFSIPARQAGEAEVQAVSLKIYNLLGKDVATLVDESVKPGMYRATWNASGCASGVYYYQLRTNQNCVTKKLMIIK